MVGYVIGVAFLLLLNIYIFLRYRRFLRKRLNISINEVSDEIIKSIPDMIFLVDKNFNIRKIFNCDAGELSVPADELIGRNLKVCIDSDCVDEVLEAVRKALKSDKVSEAEYSITFRGKKSYYEGRYKRVSEGMVACFERNVTERRIKDMAIEQNGKLLNAVLDNMPMPLIVKDIDDQLKYIFWNKQCELNGGYTREQIIGKSDIEIYGEERGCYYQSVDKKIIEEGGSYRAQEIYVTPDGIKHYSVVNKDVISNDVHHWLLATRWDVTDLIEVQEKLQEANRQMRIAFMVTYTVPVIWDVIADNICLKFPEYKENREDFFKDRNGISVSEVVRNIRPGEREEVSKMLEDIRTGQIENAHREIYYDVKGKFETCYDLYLAVDKRDESGLPARIIGTLRDITENKQNEERLLEAKKGIEEIQEINQLILNHTDNGLVFLSPDYIVQWENVSKYSHHPLASRYSRGGCCYRSVLGQDEPCPSCSARRAMHSGKIEKGVRSLPGGMTVEITAIPVFDKGHKDHIRGIVLKYEDVTERLKVAAELKAAKEAAENSNRLKSLFISNMSHEIRTPLNAIVGFSQLLATAEEVEDKNEYMSIIARNNELLLQLINDILDLSKIEANTLEFVFGKVDVNEMLKGLEMSSRSKSFHPAVDIIFEPSLKECIIETDNNRVLQVISNLVSNAMKFTEKGSIRFGYDLLDNGLRFYVADTGKGIPVELQQEVFERFVKLDTFTIGTGLGLPICRNIVHRLNGEIGVLTNESGGCTFWFTLPVLPEKKDSYSDEKTLGEKVPGSIKISGKPVLLIAEDVADNYRLYHTLLKHKFTLLHAWNGEEAVKMFIEEHPEAILMDIKMPVIDGYEAVARIRALDKDIPVIAVSAYAFSDDIDRIMKSGFTGYITKPISQDRLFDALSFLVNKD